MPDDLLHRWLTADQAAERLGVKTATLYAYVSRGVLLRRKSAEGHSLFDPAEVDRLARRGRPRRQAGTSEVTIASRVTTLGEDRPYFRGHDALGLAVNHSFEEVADLLWDDGGGSWDAPAEAVALARAAQAGLPPDVLPIERLQVAVPILAVLDPLRHHRDPDTVATIGRSLVVGLVECLPAAIDPPAGPVGGCVAARLWPRITARSTDDVLLGALDIALCLLADHELAASTLAARVAASVRADPYAVVLAGIGAMGGSLHGGASLAVESLLAEIGEPANAGRVIGQRQRRGERVPGFGHVVYRDRDGRADTLLDALRGAGVPMDLTDAVLAEAGRRGLPAPNIDLALGAFSRAADMITGGGEAIFAIARTVGWLAHAVEEYENPTRLRLRAHYTG
ncbi:citrate synthase [Virgisporangium ochraceum]|uniref:citrate synthase (unknown stereospecificity) n=1 Tax=Virgisporangium ochraceum TaxID=65505 RepID=A0A8J3ZSX3_9ACTN|nr:citrate synthase [Virgisporangium ochraceum]GIJ67463.1 citrate synthase [Virgisporangium ochraceum]